MNQITRYRIACGLLFAGMVFSDRKIDETMMEKEKIVMEKIIYNNLLITSFLDKYGHNDQFEKHKKHFDEMVFYNADNGVYSIKYMPRDGNIVVHNIVKNQDFEIENPYLTKK